MDRVRGRGSADLTDRPADSKEIVSLIKLPYVGSTCQAFLVESLFRCPRAQGRTLPGTAKDSAITDTELEQMLSRVTLRQGRDALKHPSTPGSIHSRSSSPCPCCVAAERLESRKDERGAIRCTVYFQR